MAVLLSTISGDSMPIVTSPETANSNVTDGCIVFPISTYAPRNNPEDLISYATHLRKVQAEVYIMCLFFLLAGVPSNMINMIVFWKRGFKGRISLCLFFLSFAFSLCLFIFSGSWTRFIQWLLLFACRLLNIPAKYASVSKGRICTDKFTCCHTETDVADQAFYLTQSQYTDTGPTSCSADPIMPGAWQGSHWNANF